MYFCIFIRPISQEFFLLRPNPIEITELRSQEDKQISVRNPFQDSVDFLGLRMVLSPSGDQKDMNYSRISRELVP